MSWEEPGTGPFVELKDVPIGTRLMGLAPMGIRWAAKIGPKRKIRPEGNCPSCEFSVTHAWVKGAWMEVKYGP